MSNQMSWEQLRAMDLTDKTIVYCTGNDGPDQGYCLHGVVTTTEVSGDIFKVHFTEPYVRKVTGGPWEKVTEEKDWHIGWVMVDPLAPLIDEVNGILHFVCLPHHEAHIHLKKEPARQ